MANNSSAPPNKQSQEEQQMDQMVAQAVEAAAKGENVEQLLEALLSLLPNKAKDTMRSKFSAALKKRGLRQPTSDGTEIVSRPTLTRLRDIVTASMRQTMDRIAILLRNRPDIAKSVEQAGKILMKNGVIVERVNISEAELGNMAPIAGVGQKSQTTERGA